MSIRTAMLIASAIIVTMFIFQFVVMRQLSIWANETVELTLAMRLCLNVAFLWRRFWWILSPAIIGLMTIISELTDKSTQQHA
jgi:type II secretory pathway component PulF